MKRSFISFVMACVLVFALLLAGCGGGQSKAAQEPTTTVTGVAAAGSPIAGAIVSLKDSSDPAREINTATAADGSFAFDVQKLTGPFMLRIEWTSGSASRQLYSLASGPATANINPLTNAAVATAARVPDLALLYGKSDPMTFKTIAKHLPAAIDTLRAKLSPLFEQYKTAQNPVTDTFRADHTGMDKMFDDVVINVTNGTITVMNRDGRMIFSAPVSDVASGIFKAQNMPEMAGSLPATGTDTSPAPAPVEDGALLYSSNCSTCHGTLAVTGKRGATAARIQSAINNNSGAMGSLSTLSAAEIQAIADVLAVSPAPVPTPAPAPDPIDGASLYSTYCGGCHSGLATSAKRGTTTSKIETAINNNSGGMGALSTLTTAEMQAIATALSSTAPVPAPAPTDGKTLYDTYCSSCHRALSTSEVRGASASEIQSEIRGTRSMHNLSGLTLTQVQAIATALK